VQCRKPATERIGGRGAARVPRRVVFSRTLQHEPVSVPSNWHLSRLPFQHSAHPAPWCHRTRSCRKEFRGDKTEFSRGHRSRLGSCSAPIPLLAASTFVRGFCAGSMAQGDHQYWCVMYNDEGHISMGPGDGATEPGTKVRAKMPRAPPERSVLPMATTARLLLLLCFSAISSTRLLPVQPMYVCVRSVSASGLWPPVTSRRRMPQLMRVQTGGI
jgi:hypothetical protein